jgi:hypothetical protein
MRKPPNIVPASLPMLLLVLLYGLPGVVTADSDFDPYREYRGEDTTDEFEYDDSQDIPWIENETEVLAPPRDEDLVQVAVDRLPAEMELLIDERRITVNPDDRVIRLWLVVRSRAGVSNGSFEGYRCETREFKVYAYANTGRTPPVSKAKRPRWQAIGKRLSGNYRLELLQDYFCGLGGTRDADEIRYALRGEIERETFFKN